MPKALVTIANTDLPTPSTYTGTETTVVDAARNVAGYVVGAVVRESIAKVECVELPNDGTVVVYHEAV